MLTLEERKRLDELEFLEDLGGINPHQHDDLERLRDLARAVVKGQFEAFTKAQAHGVDIVAVLTKAMAETPAVDARSDLRKAIEAVK